MSRLVRGDRVRLRAGVQLVDTGVVLVELAVGGYAISFDGGSTEILLAADVEVIGHVDLPKIDEKGGDGGSGTTSDQSF